MRRLAAFAAAFCFSAAAFAQDKPLVVGFDGTFAPHAMPKLGGGIEGFNVDLVLEAGKRMGRKIEVFAGEFSGLIPAMNAGKLDFVGAPTTVTPERAQNLLFSEGYLNTFYAFVTAAGKPELKSLDDLKGKTIASNKGSAYDKWLQDNASKYGLKAESYGTNADAMQAVITGRADAALSGNTTAAYAVFRANNQLKVSPLKIDQGLVWGAAFRKGDTQLRDAFDAALECMKKDGTIAKLHEKWFGAKPEPGSAAVTVFPGRGVPGMAGYDPTPQTTSC
ncbi:MAG TPA: transporter substrate-binding domain-containing protein [Burkholderiaceae bacterium]|jgi:polar amino acid transport system substrate-binding protein|nr:transporter substrate-binding domain-containing protein [Burkholderiaceae bacterium]